MRDFKLRFYISDVVIFPKKSSAPPLNIIFTKSNLKIQMMFGCLSAIRWTWLLKNSNDLTKCQRKKTETVNTFCGFFHRRIFQLERLFRVVGPCKKKILVIGLANCLGVQSNRFFFFGALKSYHFTKYTQFRQSDLCNSFLFAHGI